MCVENRVNGGFEGLESEFGGRIGGRIVHLRRCFSTMDVAREMGDSHGVVVVADEQLRGRGRFDRVWDSVAGEDLLISVIVAPRMSISGRLTMVASLSASLAVEDVTNCVVEIKWPNDVLVGGRKVCGVIAEGSMVGESFVGVLGIGLNVNMQNARVYGRKYDATSVREVTESGGWVDRMGVLRVFLERLNEVYGAVDRGESILGEWRGRLGMLGSKVSVSVMNEGGFGEIIEGIAEDVDEFGRLLIRESDGVLRVVSSGEVTLRVGD